MNCAYCGRGDSATEDRDTMSKRRALGNVPLCARCAESPEWWKIMGPLGNSPLWPRIRNAASAAIVRDMGEDSGFGISSSDINHTVYAEGRAVFARYGNVNPFIVVAWLEER